MPAAPARPGPVPPRPGPAGRLPTCVCGRALGPRSPLPGRQTQQQQQQRPPPRARPHLAGPGAALGAGGWQPALGTAGSREGRARRRARRRPRPAPPRLVLLPLRGDRRGVPPARPPSLSSAGQREGAGAGELASGSRGLAGKDLPRLGPCARSQAGCRSPAAAVAGSRLAFAGRTQGSGRQESAAVRAADRPRERLQR